jgi:hypothetical protein
MVINGFNGRSVSIVYVGGPRPYLWIGDPDPKGDAVGTVDTVKGAKALKKLCENMIAKLEKLTPARR